MTAERGSWGSLFSSASRPIAIIIAVGIALHSANIYVASAVMPSVPDDIGGLSLYAWATTVFVFAAVLGSVATATLLARSGIRGAYRLAVLTVGAGNSVASRARSDTANLTRAYRKISARSGTELAPRLPPT